MSGEGGNVEPLRNVVRRAMLRGGQALSAQGQTSAKTRGGWIGREDCMLQKLKCVCVCVCVSKVFSKNLWCERDTVRERVLAIERSVCVCVCVCVCVSVWSGRVSV